MAIWGRQALTTVYDMFLAAAAREMDVPKAVDEICNVMRAADMPADDVVKLGLHLCQSANPTDAVHKLM